MDSPLSSSTGDSVRRTTLWSKFAIAVVLATIATGVTIGAYRTRRPTFSANLLVSGNVEAYQSLLSFKQIQSRIKELSFDEGQWVDRGTILAYADDEDYRQRVTLGESQLAASEQETASSMLNLVAARKTVLADEADSWQKWADYRRYEELWRQRIIAE
jgi:multidrug efflux pump subunit AcrA (membrane-fusion protein)